MAERTPTSTSAEKAMQKIQDKITCGICLEPYKQPKLLNCYHIFCKECLILLVKSEGEHSSLSCPTCRKVTCLPKDGVQKLEGAFYLVPLLEFQEMFQKGEFKDCCPTHPEKVAELYCEDCDKLICSQCLVIAHQSHAYDLVSNPFTKHEEMIVDSLKPIGEQISSLNAAIEAVNTECNAVVQQKTAVLVDIHMTFAQLQTALDTKETELVHQTEKKAEHILTTLTAQRKDLEQQLNQLKRFQDFVEESQHTCTQGKILGMKSHLLERVKSLTNSFEPKALEPATFADMRFAHGLPDLLDAVKQFGKVYSPEVCQEKCQASGKGIKLAIRGQIAHVSVKALDTEGELYLRPAQNVRCELVATDGTKQSEGTVERNHQHYDIRYQVKATRDHWLHILIEEQPILNSPFTVTVLPNLDTPANIISDINDPFAVAVTEDWEVVVTESAGDCISIISTDGEKKSFGTSGSGSGQLSYPKGLAIDSKGNILVANCGNHRISKFSSTGKHNKTVGKRGNGFLQFQHPTGIAVHPITNKIYVADTDNHRIQVLNSDLRHSTTFGSQGTSDGEFNRPYDIAADSEGNVYIADSENHRIQVFTASGVYLKQFGTEGEGEGELNRPVGIAIDSKSIVYVSEWKNNRISVFSTSGDFITLFGGQGSDSAGIDWPFGLTLDKKGDVYVCDRRNKRILIFN